MDAPVVELPSGLRKGVESRRWPHKYALQPDGEGLDGLGRCTWLSVDFDDVGSIPGTVLFGVARHCALLQLFDPLDLSLKTVADVDGERGVFGVENVPLWATLDRKSVV